MTVRDTYWDDVRTDAAPPRAPVGPLESLSDQLEMATDAFAKKCNAAAEAENAYLRAYARAFTTFDGPATIRPKSAEVAAVEERAAWNLALAAEKSARAKVDELKNRLMAAMSYTKYLGWNDGGRS